MITNYTPKRTYYTRDIVNARKLLALLEKIEQWKRDNQASNKPAIARKVTTINQLLK